MPRRLAHAARQARSGTIVQRIANYIRRLARRGMPHGPDFDPAHPDDQERGLLGNFIGASLGAQFEAIMCDWLNLASKIPTSPGLTASASRRRARKTSIGVGAQ